MSKHRILRRVRKALEARQAVDHPGEFSSWRETSRDGPHEEGERAPGNADGERPGHTHPTAAFQEAFREAGGEVVRVANRSDARGYVGRMAQGLPGISAGVGVPEDFLPGGPRLAPREAPLGVSMARGAVAETGSLLMDARDGRRAQLLPPVHVVLVREETIHETLADALTVVAPDLPSGLGLHSGPSKSADIGQVLVEGVHGPGRVVAVVVANDGPAPGPDTRRESAKR